jgi:hypothetical protein
MITPAEINAHNINIDGEKVVAFGKFKGQTFHDVYAVEHDYCEYIRTLESTTYAMTDFQNYINSCRWLN